MNKELRYSDKEWEELASFLSEEKAPESGLLERFNADDKHNISKKWKELNKMKDDKEINVEKAWNNLYDRINEYYNDKEINKKKPTIALRTVMKVAAIACIVMGLGITALYFVNPDIFSKNITVATGMDQKNIQVLLPDGSRIFLNRNSELSYHASFGGKTRNVKFQGEAFFEIAPDPEKPFSIDASAARIRVVGTSFNVITSNIDSEVEVFVNTGKVLLSDNAGTRSMSLEPGYIGTMGSNESARKLNNNPNYLAWKTGLLVYNGQKLDVVFSDLKRVYNMEIIADDSSILENTWTSPIDNQQQETIIRLICVSFNLSYTKDGNVYHLMKK